MEEKRDKKRKGFHDIENNLKEKICCKHLTIFLDRSTWKQKVISIKFLCTSTFLSVKFPLHLYAKIGNNFIFSWGARPILTFLKCLDLAEVPYSCKWHFLYRKVNFLKFLHWLLWLWSLIRADLEVLKVFSSKVFGKYT